MSDEGISGRELDMLLAQKKPMAVFYKAVGELCDEKDGQEFYPHVIKGDIVKKRFFIKNTGQNFRLVYTVYCLKGEEWRVEIYREIKKIGQDLWNEQLEKLEGWLLGY